MIATSPTTSAPTMRPAPDALLAAWRRDPRPGLFWAPGPAPRHAPPDLRAAFEQGVFALVAHPGRRTKISLRGAQVPLAKVADHLWACPDPLSPALAGALATIDVYKGSRWLSEDRTLAEAARFIKALVVF